MIWSTPALVLLVVSVLRGDLAAGSLADAAFFESLRRALSPVATRSMTMADVPLAEAKRVEAPMKVEAPAVAVLDAPAKVEKVESVGTESEWRERMTTARVSLARDELLAEAMQGRVNGLVSESIARDDPAQRAELMRQRDRAQAELDRLRTQVESDKRAIASIEEEARAKGVPPGWIRILLAEADR